MRIIFEVNGSELASIKNAEDFFGKKNPSINTFELYLKDRYKSALKNFKFVTTVQKEDKSGVYDAYHIIFEERLSHE